MEPLTLAPDVYWRLRFRQADAETAAARLEVARLRLEVEARAVGMPEVGEFRWDDASMSLVPVADVGGTNA